MMMISEWTILIVAVIQAALLYAAYKLGQDNAETRSALAEQRDDEMHANRIQALNNQVTQQKKLRQLEAVHWARIQDERLTLRKALVSVLEAAVPESSGPPEAEPDRWGMTISTPAYNSLLELLDRSQAYDYGWATAGQRRLAQDQNLEDRAPARTRQAEIRKERDYFRSQIQNLVSIVNWKPENDVYVVTLHRAMYQGWLDQLAVSGKADLEEAAGRADFEALVKRQRDETILTLGVPPTAVGNLDTENSANAQERPFSEAHPSFTRMEDGDGKS